MIYVLLPAYNEERAMRPVLTALARVAGGPDQSLHVVVVNDGSTDATAEEARKVAGELGMDLAVLDHARNRGLGAALRTGIEWCLERAGPDDVIVTLDADATHPPDLIPRIVARLGEGYDLVVASRYHPEAVVRGVPAHRRALSDAGRLVFQTFFHFPGVRDYTCCFRGYKAAALRRARSVYGAELVAAPGFEAVMDLLLRLRQVGVRATEVPLTLDYSARAGASKMKVLQTIRATLALLGRRFIERFTRYSPSRVRAILNPPPNH